VTFAIGRQLAGLAPSTAGKIDQVVGQKIAEDCRSARTHELSDELEPVSFFADEQMSGSNQLTPCEKSGVA
jgi:hypothetical protein